MQAATPASSASTPPPSSSKAQPLPEGTGKIGMLLFLAALFMLFAASMVGYVLIRLAATRDVLPPGGVDFRPGVPLGSLSFPNILWLSTVVILLSGVTMQLALRAIRSGARVHFQRWLLISCVLAAAFVLVQVPAMGWIIADHWTYIENNTAMYGLVFVLILLHALHVIGGLIPLGIITVKGHKGVYSESNHDIVTFTTMYWHFLDAVWIVMFALMVLLG